ncbi:3,4-dihydroxy-2-butanone-4-phosphate synthase [Granulicella aggregans]|jgi:3,4-dihydroxy 2-butanone 4-phosphate synthase|uniref:3,4-dihydroxy-2-butanone-4-phosphate synthase n=1 Tax=Granulicella aggregans TaxID=474949 RepID=UPI0021E0F91B|nr:3,4-dihydroxy-2-butanone-4-phosphate synthase [Granulicella aggregans]
MSPLSSVVMTSPSLLFPFEERLARAIEEMRLGRPIILVDDFDRENEADLVTAAETISVPTMAQFIREGSGIVCLCLTSETLDRLDLPQMVSTNESCHQTAFTITIDARDGISTGVSAADRVATIRAAVAADAQPRDLVRPGHVFPLRAAPGGVLEREGHTEGSVDLAQLSGLQPAAVICEITNPDGSMAKGTEVSRFARRYDLVTLSISELVEYRRCDPTFRLSTMAC